MDASARREPDWIDAARVGALVLAVSVAVRFLPLGTAPQLLLLQAGFLAVPLAYARAAGLRPLQDAGFGRPRARDLLLTLAASMASLWMLKALADLQSDLFVRFGRGEVVVQERQQIERMMSRAQASGGLLGFSLLAIVPPLCEETLFRGLLLRGLARSFGAAAALAGSTALFSIMHGRDTQYLLMAFLGLYFGGLAWLTGNLWAPILAHALNNAAVVVLQLGWGPGAQDLRPSWPLLALSTAVFAGALGVLALDRRARLQALEGGRPSPPGA